MENLPVLPPSSTTGPMLGNLEITSEFPSSLAEAASFDAFPTMFEIIIYFKHSEILPTNTSSQHNYNF